MANGTKRKVGLSNLAHRDSGLHAGGSTRLLQEVLQSQRVHYGAQHTHVVRARALHATLGKFCTAEEVTATNNDCYLYAATNNISDLFSYICEYIGINTDAFISTENFSRKLKEHSAVLTSGTWHECSPRLLDLIPVWELVY
mgnify:CR=1 FL=1